MEYPNTFFQLLICEFEVWVFECIVEKGRQKERGEEQGEEGTSHTILSMSSQKQISLSSVGLSPRK